MPLKIDVKKVRPNVVSALLGRYSDVALALVLLSVLSLLVLPVPTLLLDLAIALNFSFSMVLLASAIHLRSALDLSVFPSLLLLSTLFRLGLSVATTKMILLQGHAGDIIHTFGSIVVGGNIVVGLVIFSVLCAVQFIVVAKGGDRVAEVGARFTLDAIPGRQMSIDADLRAGTIGPDEARARRQALEKGIQFYGAMDGAMKFVKGDAIIGVLIAIVNILGGIAIGMLYRDMSIGDAVQTYTVLTVGDGLVSQIPSLIVSITAGLIITRGESGGAEDGPDHLGRSIFDQLGLKFRPLAMAAVAALLMALIPGFPHVQFIVIGGVLLVLAWAARRQVHADDGVASVPVRSMTRDGSSYTVGMLDVVEMGTSAPLAVCMGERAITALAPAAFDHALGRMRQRLMAASGLPFPGLSLRVDAETEADAYLIEVNGAVVASGRLLAGQVFVPAPPGPIDLHADAQECIEGVGSGHWADPGEEEAADALGPEEVLARHLHVVCRQWAATFVGTQEVAFLQERLSILFPDLVDSLRSTLPASTFAGVLRCLLNEGISIRNLRGIVEAIVSSGPQARVEEIAVRAVRVAVRKQILWELKDPVTGKLPCLLLHPDFDRTLVRAVEIEPSGESRFSLDGETMATVSATIQHARQTWGDQVVVLTGPLVRAHLADLVRHAGWRVSVLAMDEMDLEVAPLDPKGVIELWAGNTEHLIGVGGQAHE